MLTTAELRWFCRGTVPAAVEDWFQQGCSGEDISAAERTDLYLATSSEYLGIKLRQEQLEIKWRDAALGVLQFSDAIAGQLEKWVKWTCQPVPATLPEVDLATGRWIRVHKVRSQRRYQVFPDQSPTAVPAAQSIPQGCSVELTQLSVGETAWWSLALEAFSKDADPTDVLQTVAHPVLATYSGLKLPVQNSYAYPQWLSQMTSN